MSCRAYAAATTAAAATANRRCDGASARGGPAGARAARVGALRPSFGRAVGRRALPPSFRAMRSDPSVTMRSSADTDDGGGSGSDGKEDLKKSPPRRDTGIAPEQEVGIDLDGDHANGVDADGNAVFRKSGVDVGDHGYRCRWTIQGRSAQDASWETRETHWEKCDASGFKELGAEKSGFNEDGDTWWETWKEVYRVERDDRDDDSGPIRAEFIERSADKWARDKTNHEWHEKWWEQYSPSGYVERQVEKSGLHGAQAWWEKWGEQHGADGGETRKWTDKWAQNGAGTRWGDKWEERFSADCISGDKKGETWRVAASGERWSRTWGETIDSSGEVRKYGESTTGETWDKTETLEKFYYDRTPEYSWDDIKNISKRLLSIETPDEKDE